jgi:FKBP-type peptidyl-prolyl cis-trans isomerase FkpA/FKBP-type peptidyl-prolyl cis-trans isomerase FklB
LLNGEKFDSSYDRNEAIEFEIGSRKIIPGWNEGIKLMREGGKAVIIVPSDLAYGEQGKGDIAPFTTLVFEIELLEVK